MKRVICLFVVIVGFVLPLLAQNTPPKISASDAKQHVGKWVIVTGTVSQVYTSPKLVTLNLDKKYPKQPLSVVCWTSGADQFVDFRQYDGRQVQVYGQITERKGRLEIAIQSKKQLILVESPRGAKK